MTRLRRALLARWRSLAARRARGARAGAGRRPTSCSIVGYDREPDTLNRFSTHILEDIQTCVVEGLTTTDEQMNVVPLLAAEVPTLENGGVRAAARRRHGRHLEAAARTSTWHDGTPLTSADVKFTVDAINEPELQPGEHRRLRPHRVGRHARSADRGRPLQGGLRAVRTAVHPRHAAEARARGPRHRSRAATTTAAPLGTGPVSRRRVEEPASTSCSSGCRTTGAAPSTRRSSSCCSSSSRTPTRASTS